MEAGLSSLFSSAKVLILDDCQMYRTATQGMLLKLGFKPDNIVHAGEAKTALARCKAQKFDLVLCDYNLGGGADGLSFYGELQQARLLDPGCVFIIITGESKSSVFLGFAEYEPDDYLIKPINFATFKDRIFKLLTRKRVFAPALRQILAGQYAEALSAVQAALLQPSPYSQALELIQADCLRLLKQYELADNIYRALYKEHKDLQALIGLGRSLRAQKQYSAALDAFSQLPEKGPLHLISLNQRAQIFVLQHNFAAALELLDEANQLSPKNPKRQWLAALVALNQLDTGAAINHLDRAANTERQALLPSPTPILQSIRERLDQAQREEEKSANELIRESALAVRTLHELFSRPRTRYAELLLKTRMKIVTSSIAEANAHLAEYEQALKAVSTAEEQYQPDALERVDHARASFALGHTRRALELLAQAGNELAQQGADNDDEEVLLTVLKSYIAQQRHHHEELQVRAESYKQKGIDLLAQHNHKLAVESLLQAQRIIPSDTDVAYNLMQGFTKAWPKTYSVYQVAKLAMRCRKILKGSSYEHNPRYQKLCHQLAEQLQLPELTS